MACSGLHCAGCAGGLAVPVVPVVSLLGFAWVADHLVLMAATSGACGVLAVAAVVALMRWQDRRQAARGPLMVMRAEVLSGAQICRPPTDSEARIRERLTDSSPAAIAPAAVHLHFHGMSTAEQAAVIRQAIPRDAAARKEHPYGIP